MDTTVKFGKNAILGINDAFIHKSYMTALQCKDALNNHIIQTVYLIMLM